MQLEAQIIMLNIEDPKAAASRDTTVPIRKRVRKMDTSAEKIRQAGAALLQKVSVMSDE